MFNFIFSLVSDFSSCSPMEEAVAVANAEDGSKEFCVGKITKKPQVVDLNNPFGDVVTNETGETLEVGSVEYFKKLGDRSKFDKKTREAQIREFRNLELWVVQAKGADIWDRFANSTMPVSEADCLLSGYIQTRFNKTVFKKIKLSYTFSKPKMTKRTL